MESGIDPAQWRQECQRVEKKLMIPIQSSSSGNGALDEFYDRQTQVLKHLQEVSAFTEGGVPVMLDALIDCTKRDLKKIKKKETKLNTQNAEQMSQL